MKSIFGLLHRNLISAYAFFLLAALAYFCSKIYTIFTHGETSETLSLVWVFLLLFGTGVRLLAAVIFTLLKRRPRKIASDMYDSGVIAFTAGMTMRGIFEILGADRRLILYYEIVGIGLMAVGFVLIAICSKKLNNYDSKTSVFDIFITERTVERFGARIEAGELYSLHNKWAGENGYYPLSRKKFILELKRRYIVLRDGIANYTLVGVAYRNVHKRESR